jgi:peptidyl-prolyl cis-trans isomerase SurA
LTLNNSCRHCGKEAAEGALYCPQCATPSGAVKIGKIWLFAIIFSTLLLVLAGLLLWSGNGCTLNFSWDDLTGKPAAVINGETVSRKELRTRSDVARRMIERQSGDIFTGEIGQERLASLKRQVLDRILEERLVAQEARRMGIGITDVMVEDELKRIGKEINGAGENIQTMLKSQGIDSGDLQNHIRQVLTFQALAKAKIAQADKGIQPEAYLANWLGQVKKTAKVVVYDTSSAVAGTPARGGGCCATGGSRSSGDSSGSSSGCGGKGSAGGCGKN